jgi:hypothetical protein
MLQWLNTIVTWWSGKVPALPPVPEVESPELIALKKAQYQAMLAKARKESYDRYERDKIEHEKSNSICPKCGHDMVVDHIQRIQGKIDGHMGGSIFGFGGSIHGSMDTNEVNFCTKCTHQWKKGELTNWGGYSVIESYVSWLRIAISHHINLKDITFDPTDITQTFNSLEEKCENAVKTYNELCERAYKFWGDTSIEVIHQFVLEDRLSYSNKDYYIDKYFPTSVLHDGLGYKYAKEMLPV